MIICCQYRHGVINEPEGKQEENCTSRKSGSHNGCVINCTRRDSSRGPLVGGQPEPLYSLSPGEPELAQSSECPSSCLCPVPGEVGLGFKKKKKKKKASVCMALKILRQMEQSEAAQSAGVCPNSRYSPKGPLRTSTLRYTMSPLRNQLLLYH